MTETSAVNQSDGGKTITLLRMCCTCLKRSITYLPNYRYVPPATREPTTPQRRAADRRFRMLDAAKDEVAQ